MNNNADSTPESGGGWIEIIITYPRWMGKKIRTTSWCAATTARHIIDSQKKAAWAKGAKVTETLKENL